MIQQSHRYIGLSLVKCVCLRNSYVRMWNSHANHFQISQKKKVGNISQVAGWNNIHWKLEGSFKKYILLSRDKLINAPANFAHI